MQYVVDIRQGSIRHVVSGILAVAPVSPPTSLQPLQKEKCWRILNTSAVGQSHKCSTKTYVKVQVIVLSRQLFKGRPGCFNVKIFQKFTIGDFYFYITTGFTAL